MNVEVAIVVVLLAFFIAMFIGFAFSSVLRK